MANAYNKGLPYMKIFKKRKQLVSYFDDQGVILSH
jgi:hypothetical protein